MVGELRRIFEALFSFFRASLHASLNHEICRFEGDPFVWGIQTNTASNTNAVNYATASSMLSTRTSSQGEVLLHETASSKLNRLSIEEGV